MANNINNLSGKVNIPTKVATYTGLDTDTAEVIVDNVNKTIAVNVDLSDISSQFISQSKLDREIEARESGDTFLGEQLNTLSNNLETEILTRRSADEEVQKDLQKEIKRASTKEAAIESSLSSTATAIRGELQDEAQRAEREEDRLQGAIDTEAAARERNDGILQGNIDTVSNTVDHLAEVARTGKYIDLIDAPDVSDMATETWVGNQGFLTSSDISNMVTTDGDQNIVGDKHFTGNFYAQNSGEDYYINIASDAVYLGSYVEVDGELHSDELSTPVIMVPVIKASRSTYGLSVPNSSSWTADKTIATTDQIPDDSNLVHKTGDEFISGNKTFIGDVYTDRINIDGLASFNANLRLDGVTINENQDDYGLRMPDTSDYTDNHIIATLDDIPDDDNLVHKTGNETIGGNKTFTNKVDIYNGFEFRNADYTYAPTMITSSNNGLKMQFNTGSQYLQLSATPAGYINIQPNAGSVGVISNQYIKDNATLVTNTLNLPDASGTIATTDDIPDSSTLVHTTGDETILGNKTFGNNSSGTTTAFYGNMASPDVIDSTGVHFGTDTAGKRPIDAASLTAYTGSDYLGQNKTLYSSNGITYYYREYVDGTPVETSYKLNFPSKKAGTIALTDDIPEDCGTQLYKHYLGYLEFDTGYNGYFYVITRSATPITSISELETQMKDYIQPQVIRCYSSGTNINYTAGLFCDFGYIYITNAKNDSSQIRVSSITFKTDRVTKL